MTMKLGTKHKGLLKNHYSEASDNDKSTHGFIGIIFGKAAAMLDALGLRFSSAASAYDQKEEEKKKADLEYHYDLL